MKFTKAQTNGNDFVIIEGKGSELTSDQKKLIADRKFGIGCDQIVFIEKNNSIFSINFFNQDGSFADMCGNGSCAVALYIKEKFNLDKVDLEISGKVYKAFLKNGYFAVSFPIPKKEGNIIITGNKHLVLKMSDIDEVLAIASANPDCNLHFVEKVSENSLRIKTFERGVGWTLACGSGAIAVGFHSGIFGEIRIIHDGGESIVEIGSDYINLITSPKLVFEGEFYA